MSAVAELVAMFGPKEATKRLIYGWDVIAPRSGVQSPDRPSSLGEIMQRAYLEMGLVEWHEEPKVRAGYRGNDPNRTKGEAWAAIRKAVKDVHVTAHPPRERGGEGIG